MFTIVSLIANVSLVISYPRIARRCLTAPDLHHGHHSIVLDFESVLDLLCLPMKYNAVTLDSES
jgi:hypothetical protein